MKQGEIALYSSLIQKISVLPYKENHSGRTEYSSLIFSKSKVAELQSVGHIYPCHLILYDLQVFFFNMFKWLKKKKKI